MHLWGKKRESAKVRSSVREDWCTQLPDEKNRMFDSIVHRWESAYAVFSVSLDHAMALRAKGKLTRARQCVDIAAAAVTDLTEPLASSCRTLEKWGRHLAVPPTVASLNPSFSRSESARQNAQWNQLMHRVLFGSRSRFLHKLRVLEMSVSALGNEFHREAEELASTPQQSGITGGVRRGSQQEDLRLAGHTPDLAKVSRLQASADREQFRQRSLPG